ncbi:cysteine proteinase [Marasmius fiardii PR-910]|nr:cysteine proteinase [Marasmius fiardii PR-910]
MAHKRKRRASPSSKGLAAGEVLKRDRLPGNATSAWGWVGTEVNDASQMTQEHVLTVYGLNSRSRHSNKYAPGENCPPPYKGAVTGGKDEDDVIIISDDEDSQCSKKNCKNNPFCLNYLGQEKWDDEAKARNMWRSSANLGANPSDVTRASGIPVGLKVGNPFTLLKIRTQGIIPGRRTWAPPAMQMLPFRCGFEISISEPGFSIAALPKDSPIFQLQVTFTALQESIQKVFNPTKLVESLQLRTAEQQDAQEFSKLFMSHLDAEFKKQSDVRVKSLVTDQFEGEQIYGTACSNCQYKSETTSNFLELEINFQNKSKLGDCIRSLLQPEYLTADNKYLCSKCESLQDATRYTELRKLPPVLHFSLLRFAFNMATLERKKSKNIISFPREIDMGPFVQASDQASSHPSNVYELQGILLHKGPSAYHGHYEAQVYDSQSQSWFQFNDEVVTRIDRLGDIKNPSPSVNKPSNDKRSNQLSNSRKRQRVDDSDEEIIEVPVTEVSPSARYSLTQPFPYRTFRSSPLSNSSFISSKDAYMLIYVRKTPNLSGGLKPIPPHRALELVEDMNKAHLNRCKEYKQKETNSLQTFEALRSQVMDIYRTWELQSGDEDLRIVARKALESWLCNENPTDPNPVQQEILCEHGRLDYRKAKEFKCIKRSTYAQLKSFGGFDPIHKIEDICDTCVKTEFEERLYQIEHPRLVARFNELDREPDGLGYWIPKAWIRDWTLQKPKMHNPGVDDPPPDAPVFEHLLCEHGNLSLNASGRRRISVQACKILTALFPRWKPIPVDAELCPICDSLLYERKTNSLEHRKRAEEEKAKLKRVFEYAGITESNNLFHENEPLSIIPASFLRTWRLWVTKPAEYERPESLDNTIFFCEHDLLTFDPEFYGTESDVAAILYTEWQILEKIYTAGPLISFTLIKGQGQEKSVECTIPVCVSCYKRRKTEWESTDLIIRIGSAGTVDDARGPSKAKKPRTVSYGSRQSRRLRQIRTQGDCRRISVTKETTVKDIKINLQKLLDIPTICQRLIYKSQELDDGSVTLGSLGVLANDIFDFHEQNEVHEINDGDSDDESGSKRDEGRGFGGTLLGGSDVVGSTTALPSKPFGEAGTDGIAELAGLAERSCSACTFINPPSAVMCDMCGSGAFL